MQALLWRLAFAYRCTTPEIEAALLGGAKAALRILNHLVLIDRLLDRRRILVSVPPKITGPLHTTGVPDCAAIAYAAQKRITEPKFVPVFFLNERGANYLGAPRHGLKYRLQIAHD